MFEHPQKVIVSDREPGEETHARPDSAMAARPKRRRGNYVLTSMGTLLATISLLTIYFSDRLFEGFFVTIFIDKLLYLSNLWDFGYGRIGSTIVGTAACLLVWLLIAPIFALVGQPLFREEQ